MVWGTVDILEVRAEEVNGREGVVEVEVEVEEKGFLYAVLVV